MQEIEIWKDVIGYEGLYQVSDLGQVRSLDRYVYGRRGMIKSKTIKQRTSEEYLTVSLCKNGVKKQQLVHRLVAISFIENKSGKPQVNHKNGNKWDNRMSNLEWVTVKENSDHAIGVLGIVLGGETHHSAKLNEDSIRRIIDLGNSGLYTHKEISEMFNVTRTNVSLIIKRKIWKQVKIA